MALAADAVVSRVLCQEMEGRWAPGRARQAWADRAEDPSVVRGPGVFPARVLEAAESL